MIVMDKREEVIACIRDAVARGDLNARVEVDDPNLTRDDALQVLDRFCEDYNSSLFMLKTCVARAVVGIATKCSTRDTRIEGAEKAAAVNGGAIITSNHFSPIDNAVVRKLARDCFHQRYLPIVSNTTNLAMSGLFGFLMNYADIVPVNGNPRYLRHHFEPMLNARLKAGKKVLMYPEQEMWFNYRKPRPCKRGAYLYAARAGVPIISCFVEIVDAGDLQSTDFVNISYVMHVLDPIWPDPSLSAHDNSIRMCEQDYRQKAAAYERAYGKKLNYSFSQDDIAGWVESPLEEQSGCETLSFMEALVMEL